MIKTKKIINYPTHREINKANLIKGLRIIQKKLDKYSKRTEYDYIKQKIKAYETFFGDRVYIPIETLKEFNRLNCSIEKTDEN